MLGLFYNIMPNFDEFLEIGPGLNWSGHNIKRAFSAGSLRFDDLFWSTSKSTHICYFLKLVRFSNSKNNDQNPMVNLNSAENEHYKLWPDLQSHKNLSNQVCYNRPEKYNVQCIEVCFASLLSSGFTTMVVINPLKKKLANRTSVQWSDVDPSQPLSLAGPWLHCISYRAGANRPRRTPYSDLDQCLTFTLSKPTNQLAFISH